MATVFLVLVTAVLCLVTWRAANAAKESAALAAREYRLLRRPLTTVTWDDPPLRNDVWLYLSGEVKEVAGVRTRLHILIAEATPLWGVQGRNPLDREVQIRRRPCSET